MRCAALEIASAASAVRWFSFPPSPSASRTTDRATRRGINQSCYFPTLCSNQLSPRFSPPGSRGAHWKKGRVGHCPFYKIPSRTKKSCCFFFVCGAKSSSHPCNLARESQSLQIQQELGQLQDGCVHLRAAPLSLSGRCVGRVVRPTA